MSRSAGPADSAWLNWAGALPVLGACPAASTAAGSHLLGEGHVPLQPGPPPGPQSAAPSPASKSEGRLQSPTGPSDDAWSVRCAHAAGETEGEDACRTRGVAKSRGRTPNLVQARTRRTRRRQPVSQDPGDDSLAPATPTHPGRRPPAASRRSPSGPCADGPPSVLRRSKVGPSRPESVCSPATRPRLRSPALPHPAHTRPSPSRPSLNRSSSQPHRRSTDLPPGPRLVSAIDRLLAHRCLPLI